MDLAQERELVEKAKESLEAFDKLYEHYLPKIYGYIMNRTGSKEVTEDITSQTFIKAMTKIKTFEFRGISFGAWLYRIAHNSMIDYFRKHPDKKIYDLEFVKSKESTRSQAEEIERRMLILKAMSELPKQYQEVLSLKFFEDLSNEEIAEIIGCKKQTLAVKLHRSIKAFKKVMEQKGYLELKSK